MFRLQNPIARGMTTGLLLAFAVTRTSFGALMVYCPMDETVNPSVGLTVTNASGNAANGVMLTDSPGVGMGAVVGVPSVNPIYGTAYNFASAATDKNYVDINNGSSNIFTRDTALTYAVWLKPTTAQMASPATIIGTPGNGYEFRIVSSGDNWALNLFCINAPTSTLTSSIATIPGDTWTHVAIAKDAYDSVAGSANVNFYINGVLVESGTIGRSSNNGGGSAAGTVRRLFLAADGVAPVYYQGGMDELHVYNELLDSTAIAALAVPEPGALWLLSLGVVGMAGYRLRKRK